jgi:hypothetical protein
MISGPTGGLIAGTRGIVPPVPHMRASPKIVQNIGRIMSSYKDTFFCVLNSNYVYMNDVNAPYGPAPSLLYNHGETVKRIYPSKDGQYVYVMSYSKITKCKVDHATALLNLIKPYVL